MYKKRVRTEHCARSFTQSRTKNIMPPNTNNTDEYEGVINAAQTLVKLLSDDSQTSKMDISSDSSSEGGLFQCGECDNLFTQKAGLRRHRREVHEKTSVFPCRHCAKSYTRASARRLHEERMHRLRPAYWCSECRSGFIDKTQLRRHKNTVHLQLRPHACYLCVSAFGRSSDLNRHLRLVHATIPKTRGRLGACKRRRLTLRNTKAGPTVGTPPGQ